MYPGGEHGHHQVHHRDPDREVPARHEDARDAGVRALRDPRVRYVDLFASKRIATFTEYLISK